jgi:alkylhydroperoxidase/carboxymuconolactone decarboxylase family protein YurZ
VNDNDDPRVSQGQVRREQILGRRHVAANTPSTDDFANEFAQLSLAVAWGGVWSRGVLDDRMRCLATVAMLATLGMEDELAVHIRGARNVGVSTDELSELLLHVAIYAGFARARSAFKVATAVLAEEGEA